MVLVVDDDDAQRNVTRVLLQDMDGTRFHCMEAQSGERALELLQPLLAEGRQVLVLSDYRMPTMNGLELLRKAREANGGEPVPGVVFSGVADYVSETEGEQAVRILDKPYSLEEYESILRDLLAHWREGATGAALRP